jgi:SsrA-binding protein
MHIGLILIAMGKIITTNRRALRDYTILQSLECGIELKGAEVKSIREGKVNLDDSFARVDNRDVLLYNMHISPYLQASYSNVDPLRVRRLLLRRNQITKLSQKIKQKGLTLVPLKIYFSSRGFVKLELALCKGKKLYDRRQAIKRKEIERQIRKVLKRNREN